MPQMVCKTLNWTVEFFWQLVVTPQIATVQKLEYSVSSCGQI